MQLDVEPVLEGAALLEVAHEAVDAPAALASRLSSGSQLQQGLRITWSVQGRSNIQVSPQAL